LFQEEQPPKKKRRESDPPATVKAKGKAGTIDQYFGKKTKTDEDSGKILERKKPGPVKAGEKSKGIVIIAPTCRGFTLWLPKFQHNPVTLG
jgi:hypothetical protein